MKQTVWILYECDQGNRWSASQHGPYGQPHSSPCEFSGCVPGHHVYRRDETTDRRTQAEDAHVQR